MARQIILTNLRNLYTDMKAKNIDRVQFPYANGLAKFDVFFFIDEVPFSLLFGAKQSNIAFELQVEKGFIVDTFLPDDCYRALCQALGLTYDPNNPFRPGAFIEDFAKNIPTSTANLKAPQPHDLAIYRSDVEEHKKKYFCGWRDNTKRGESVTPNNLFKTKRLLGVKAHNTCLQKNLSSCWTNEKSKSISFVMP